MSLVDEIHHVGIIGVGIMGEALVSALINSGHPSEKISIYEKREDRASQITARYKVRKSKLDELCSNSDIVLLVTKPQDLGDLLDQIANLLKKDVTLVSFAAGKKISFINQKVPFAKVIRVMPNTPLIVNKGMSVISTGEGVPATSKEFVLKFLASCGKVIVVDENLQDAVTATSGSGPAYFFAFVEEMIKGAVALGLSEQDATTLTIQTIAGAAQMLETTGESPTKLRENVTSPNGTTAAAIKTFDENKFGEIIHNAMKAAKDRSQELA